MVTRGRVMVVEIGESQRLALPVWSDLVDSCRDLGVDIVSLPIGAGPEQVEDARKSLAHASGIAVFACPDPSTRVAHDLVASLLGPSAITGVETLLDKGATRQLCAALGVATPQGAVGSGTALLTEAAQLLAGGGRLVVKDPTGYAGDGKAVVDDDAGLERALATLETAVVEAFVKGEEFSVEAVTRDGTVDVVGWLAKGDTTSPVHPLLRLRYSPPEPVPAVLREPVEALLLGSGYQGVAEVDLVVGDEGAVVLECNPRTSGVTASLFFTGRASSLRRDVAALSGVSATSGVMAPVVDFQLFDERPVHPSERVEVYVQQPPPETEFEVRAYVVGPVDGILATLADFDPSLTRQFTDRLDAVAALVARDVTARDRVCADV